MPEKLSQIIQIHWDDKKDHQDANIRIVATNIEALRQANRNVNDAHFIHQNPSGMWASKLHFVQSITSQNTKSMIFTIIKEKSLFNNGCIFSIGAMSWLNLTMRFHSQSAVIIAIYDPSIILRVFHHHII